MDTNWIFLGIAVYSAGVGIATFASGISDNSPTADTIAGLPSVGSFLNSTGTTAALMDIAAGAAIWWWVMRSRK